MYGGWLPCLPSWNPSASDAGCVGRDLRPAAELCNMGCDVVSFTTKHVGYGKIRARWADYKSWFLLKRRVLPSKCPPEITMQHFAATTTH